MTETGDRKLLTADEVKSLGTELPKQIARVQEILGQYIAIGPNGAFGAAFIRADLANATKAMMEGDVVEMLRAYNTLKEIES